MMSVKKAVEVSGRSETWLRTHQCQWCDQIAMIAMSALRGGCGAIGELKCKPEQRDYHTKPMFAPCQ